MAQRVGGRRIAVRVAGIVALAAVASACAGVGGTPTVSGATSRAASAVISAAVSSTPSSTATAAGTAAPTTAAAGTAAVPSAPAGNSVPSSRPAAALGLPHSTPLANNILLSTRVANGNEDLYQVDTTTGAVGAQVTKGAKGPQFPILSPDRGTVVYLQAGEENELRTAAVDGTGDRQLFTSTPDGCQTVLRPAWNPVDPSELAIACGTGDGTTELKLVGVDGTVRVTLNPGIARLDDLSFSPDGKSLVYWGSQSKDGDGGPLFLQPADGSGLPKQITTPGGANDADAVFAPDGTTIFFRRATANSSQIISVHTDGTGLTPLTDGTSTDQDPSISPDGTQIAFKSNRNNAAGTSDAQIWVIGVDGNGLRQLGIGSPGTTDGAPAWGHR